MREGSSRALRTALYVGLKNGLISFLLGEGNAIFLFLLLFLGHTLGEYFTGTYKRCQETSSHLYWRMAWRCQTRRRGVQGHSWLFTEPLAIHYPVYLSLQGQGEHYSTNGDKYSGEWINDKREVSNTLCFWESSSLFLFMTRFQWNL